jgi:crotonobetainyl-CoA:carnitine CoA-transferase CaiB-like acyl-CoA transferase
MLDGALQGYKVLDLSRLLPGPFCSMLLADLGADVVKVEEPNRGDYIRWWPPKLGPNSGFHVVLNRNKRSLTLNLKAAEGKKILLRLVREADVLLEGFRPGVMNRLGLSYEALKEVNPRLIYCSVTGYGADGKRAGRAAHDINFIALNDLFSWAGEGRPIIPTVPIADLGAAIYAAFAVVSALLARERLGEGQLVDVSASDAATTWNCMRWGQHIAGGAAPSPGDDFPRYACYSVYETRDGRFMALGALEPQFWSAFCEAVGHPEWNRPDYFSPGAHQPALRESVAAVFKEKSQTEWIDFFARLDCCCEPVLNLAEVMSHPEVRARGMVVEMVHDTWGAYRQLGIAPKFSKTPGAIRSHAPDLGEHTDEILREMGFSAAVVEQLRSRGVV